MSSINWAALPLQAIGLLAGLTFISSLIGHALTRNPFFGAIITAVVFILVYVGWNHYPHGLAPGLRFPG
jgi:hypothetical protein